MIEAGHYEAKGVLAALPNAPQPPATATISAFASADVAGQRVEKQINSLGVVKLAAKPKVTVQLLPVERTSAEQTPPVHFAERKFEVLVPSEYRSVGGATLTKLDDHSLRASGTNPDTDTYTVTCTTTLNQARAIRLDVLGDDTLPGKAPGRAETNGNFVLSEFSLTVAPTSDPTKQTPVKIKSAKVDYTQPGWSAEALLDGNPKTGWAIAEPGPNNTFPVKRNGDDLSHNAIFELAEPLTLAEGMVLTFTLAHNSDVKQHNLGRFKLSASADEQQDIPHLPRNPYRHHRRRQRDASPLEGGEERL